MRPHSTATAAALEAAIVDILTEQPNISIEAICKQLGRLRGTVSARLMTMWKEKRLVRSKVPNPHGGCHYLWAVEAQPIETHSIETPYQQVIRVYPAIRRRDPLVAAFFGQAGEAA